MSTKSTIGLARTGTHLYKELIGDGIYVERDRPYEVIRVCSFDEWDDIQADIIANWLTTVANGSCRKLEYIWGADSPIKLDRKDLVAKLERLIADVPN